MKPNTYINPSKIHGVGLFADVDIKAGEMILHAETYDLNKNTDAWIQYLKTTKKKSMALCLGYCAINHSDQPNTERGGDDNDIFAKVDIPAGTEITENYNELPDNENPFIAEVELAGLLNELATEMVKLEKRSQGK